eukprot:scaffold64815_cov34-Tisochrysis_lutea.AAC.4
MECSAGGFVWCGMVKRTGWIVGIREDNQRRAWRDGRKDCRRGEAVLTRKPWTEDLEGFTNPGGWHSHLHQVFVDLVKSWAGGVGKLCQLTQRTAPHRARQSSVCTCSYMANVGAGMMASDPSGQHARMMRSIPGYHDRRRAGMIG